MSTFDDIREDKKDIILRKATYLFSRYGFTGVGIRKIAEESECNVAAISYYFGGKDRLYAECFRLGNEKEITSIVALLSPASGKEDFELKLKTFYLSLSQHISLHSNLVRLVVSELNSQILQPPETASQMFSPLKVPMNSFFTAAVRDGLLIDNLNVSLLSRTILNAIITEIVFLKEFDSIEDFIEQLITICTGSIYA